MEQPTKELVYVYSQMQKKIAIEDFNKVLERKLGRFTQWKHVLELQSKTTSCCKKISKWDYNDQWNDRHTNQLSVNPCKRACENI